MRRLFLLLFGYRRYRVPSEYAAKITEIFARTSIAPFDMRHEGEYLSFSVLLWHVSRLLSACEESGIPCEHISSHGFPELVIHYRHRYGIAVGLVLCVATVVASGRFLWKIEIDGNSTVSDEQVLLELRDCGLTVGKLISSIDTDSIEKSVMIYSDEIAWISVNLRGNVAHVILRELETPPVHENYEAANIVAARDGVIYLFEDVRGQPVVSIGDRVSAGELIVSGLYDTENGELRYRCAEGRVLARTERELCINVPFAYKKKVYTGRERVRKYLVFFEKEIKIYESSGNPYPSCDTIDTVEYLDVFSQGKLPVGIRTVREREYVLEDSERSPEQARQTAEQELVRRISEELSEVEILNRRISGRENEDGYTLEWYAECIEDIASVREIFIGG